MSDMQLTRPSRVSPRVSKALGIQPGDSQAAHLGAAARIRAEQELENERVAAPRRRLAAAPEWIQDVADVATKVTSIRSTLLALFDLSPEATQSEVLERVVDVFEYGTPAEQKELASAVLIAKTAELQKADPKLSHGDALARASREHRAIFAAARLPR